MYQHTTRTLCSIAATFICLAFTSACGHRGEAGAPAAPATTDITWGANATQHRGRVGTTLTLRCPPNGTAGTVWGTDLYSDDSSICTAALHAGRVTLQGGGVIQVTIAPGAPRYQGTLRNNVTTRDFGRFPGSFTIVGGAAPGLVAVVPAAQQPSWSATATAYRGRNGEAMRVECPANGAPATVWGTDVYTDDSSVCTAALHAGRIQATGGAVTIYIRGGQRAYRGSARNGVTTRDFATFPGSFTFDPNVPGEVAAPAGTTAIGWRDTATQFRGRDGDTVRIFCPPGGTPATVWGERPYTDDSSICTAAVHAGLATFAEGGTFSLRVMAGKRRYRGSSRNGVTSQDYARFPGSFALSR